MRARADSAVSEAVGTVLMVAMAIVLAGVVYVFVAHGSSTPAPPPAMALASDAGATPTDRAYTVSAVSTPIRWAELEVRLGGVGMTYDSSLSHDATYCVVLAGTTCSPASPDSQSIQAGQTIRLHDSTLAGKRLLVVVPEQNAAILAVNLG